MARQQSSEKSVMITKFMKIYCALPTLIVSVLNFAHCERVPNDGRPLPSMKHLATFFNAPLHLRQTSARNSGQRNCLGRVSRILNSFMDLSCQFRIDESSTSSPQVGDGGGPVACALGLVTLSDSARLAITADAYSEFANGRSI